MDWIVNDHYAKPGEKVWEPMVGSGVTGAKLACRRPVHGETWTQFAWLPGVDAVKAEEIIEDFGWGEDQGRPGGVFHRRPRYQQTDTGVPGVLVRWSGGWDV